MTDLKKQVEQSAEALRDAWTNLNKVPESASLPLKCYELWMKRALLHEVLTGTIAIFEARDKAWEVVGVVAKAESVVPRDEPNRDPTSVTSPNAVMYGNIQMEYCVARHLVLASYASVVWSIYDRLANVCGRLAGVAEVAQNPRQNPKTCEDFLGKKDVLGFASHLHMRESYSWPLKISYKVRNWLVHEGYEEGGTPLFSGDRVSDRFFLHSDAVNQLQGTCGFSDEDGKIALSCVGKDKECWSRGDLIEILELYHSEIDTMFAALLKWSVDSFVGQIKIFAARDQA